MGLGRIGGFDVDAVIAWGLVDCGWGIEVEVGV